MFVLFLVLDEDKVSSENRARNTELIWIEVGRSWCGEEESRRVPSRALVNSIAPDSK